MQGKQSIVVDPKSPGGINSPHGLILFDGVCVLCSRGCRFVSKRDRRGYFRFVPIQLTEGRPLAYQLGIAQRNAGPHGMGDSRTKLASESRGLGCRLIEQRGDIASILTLELVSAVE